jgi:hypothetical protein
MAHEAIEAARKEAKATVAHLKPNDVKAKLLLLLTDVNDRVDGILNGPQTSDEKIAILQAFVLFNRDAGIAEIVELSGAK